MHVTIINCLKNRRFDFQVTMQILPAGEVLRFSSGGWPQEPWPEGLEETI